MDTIFLVCAAFGSVILVWQFVMTVLGLGGDHGGDVDGGIDVGGDGFSADGGVDVSHDVGGHDHSGGDLGTDHGHHSTISVFKVLTFQTLVAAIAFFGLAGKAALSSNASPVVATLIAVVAGLGAMYGVYSMLRGMHKFNADGTLQIGRAVGLPGTVYIPVPGSNSGAGKVQMNVQNRVVEFQAMTAQDRLPSGAKVRVIRVIGPDTVEVERLIEVENTSHV